MALFISKQENNYTLQSNSTTCKITQNLFEKKKHRKIENIPAVELNTETRSKLKWVLPNLLFYVEKGDIPRSLYCVHCKSYISHNN